MVPATLREMTQMWDSSQLASSGGSSLATLDSSFASGSGSAAGKSGAATGGGRGAESLENSLVIQPRVLRPEAEAEARAVAARLGLECVVKRTGYGDLGTSLAAFAGRKRVPLWPASP